MDPDEKNWFELDGADEVASPALLVYPDRITQNIRRMVATVGGAKRLRPHIKTHKMAEVVRLHLELGVTKFKAATIAEAEMAAGCGAAVYPCTCGFILGRQLRF
ncbi:MAG: alanine racemase [Candidatus Sumerlaeaceae bacterium]